MRKKSFDKSENWSKIDRQMIMFIIITLIILIALVLSLAKILKTNDKPEDVISYSTGETIKSDKIDKLRSLGEHDRILKYMGEIVTHIKSKDYKTLYSKLYPDYKKEYFKTFSDFKNYMENVIPKNLAYSEKNFERIGEYYILKIDMINTSNFKDAKNRYGMFFVFKEFNFDDYYFSFSKSEFKNTGRIDGVINKNSKENINQNINQNKNTNEKTNQKLNEN